MSSNKIDNRIVEMSFENKSFEKGISDSTKSLADFDKALKNSLELIANPNSSLKVVLTEMIEEINKLLGWKIQFEKVLNTEGEVSALSFQSKLLSFSAPVKNK